VTTMMTFLRVATFLATRFRNPPDSVKVAWKNFQGAGSATSNNLADRPRSMLPVAVCLRENLPPSRFLSSTVDHCSNQKVVGCLRKSQPLRPMRFSD
jgi:hypothetical protein